MMSEIKAIIFDMDGVLQDSETISDRTWRIVAKSWGICDIESMLDICRGCNKNDTYALLRKKYGNDFESEKFLESTSALFFEIEKSEGIPLMNGAKETLEYLSKKYTLALASSTQKSSVVRQMQTANFLQFFKTLTTGDMVSHSKPNPEIYEKACASLSLLSNECVAIEDSPNGVRSASRAGLRVIMIPDKIKPDDEMRTLAWKIFSSLWDVKNNL